MTTRQTVGSKGHKDGNSRNGCGRTGRLQEDRRMEIVDLERGICWGICSADFGDLDVEGLELSDGWEMVLFIYSPLRCTLKSLGLLDSSKKENKNLRHGMFSDRNDQRWCMRMLDSWKEEH